MKFLKAVVFCFFIGSLQLQAGSDTLYGLNTAETSSEVFIFNLQSTPQVKSIPINYLISSLSVTPSGSQIYLMPVNPNNGPSLQDTAVLNTQLNTLTNPIPTYPQANPSSIYPLGTGFYNIYNFLNIKNQSFFPAQTPTQSTIGLGKITNVANTGQNTQNTQYVTEYIALKNNLGALRIDENVLLFNIISPNESLIFLSTQNVTTFQGEFYQFNTSTSAITTISLEGLNNYVPLNGVFSADNTKIYLLAGENIEMPTEAVLAVFDITTSTFTILETLQLDFITSPNSSFVISLDGTKIYLSLGIGISASNIYIIDTSTNSITTTVFLNQGIYDTALSSDGSLLYYSANLVNNNTAFGIFALNTTTNQRTPFYISTTVPMDQIVIVSNSLAKGPLNNATQHWPAANQMGRRFLPL